MEDGILRQCYDHKSLVSFLFMIFIRHKSNNEFDFPSWKRPYITVWLKEKLFLPRFLNKLSFPGGLKTPLSEFNHRFQAVTNN